MIGYRVTRGGIGYREAGSGPAVLCLHGLGSNSRSWRFQLEDLAGDYRVIAWDAPGYGESVDPGEGWTIAEYAAALAGFVEELELDGVHLVGHSMGGVIALAFCAEHGDCLASLVLSDSYCGGASRPVDDSPRVLQRIADFEALPRQEFARTRVPRLLGPDSTAEVRDEAVQIMASLRSPAYGIANRALLEADVRGSLRAVQVPTSVLCGELDSVTPPDESRLIAGGISAAELTLIPGAGHLANQEQPVLFNGLLRTHLLAAARMAAAARPTREGRSIATN